MAKKGLIRLENEKTDYHFTQYAEGVEGTNFNLALDEPILGIKIYGTSATALLVALRSLKEVQEEVSEEVVTESRARTEELIERVKNKFDEAAKERPASAAKERADYFELVAA